MKVFFYSEREHSSSASTTEIPEHLHSFLLDFAEASWTPGYYGGILRQEILSEHYLMSILDFFIEEPVSLTAYVEEPTVTFAFIISGKLSCDLNGVGNVFLQEATNYIFYVPANVKHTVRFTKGHFRVLHFSLQSGLLSELARDYSMIDEMISRLNSPDTNSAQQLEVPFTLRTWAILHDVQHYTPADGHLQTFMHSRLFEFLVEYSKALRQARRFVQNYGVDVKTLADRLLLAKQMIDENVGAPLLLEAVARKSGLNSKQLKTGFKDMFLTNFGQYQLLQRMERAVSLLVETNDSIESICDSIGYEDRSSFTRKFKQIYNVTPLQYRMRFKIRR